MQRRLIPFLIPLLGMMMTPLRLEGQAPRSTFRGPSHTAVGYAGAFPSAEAGAGVLHFLGVNGLGVLVEGKRSVEDVEGRYNFCPAGLGECTSTWVLSQRNDRLLRTPEEWTIVNMAGVVAITDDLAAVIGAGAAHRTVYREYWDPEQEEALRITPDGTYYVPDPEEDGWQAQLVAGVLLRAGSLAFRFGWESAPNAASVGVFLFVR